MAGMHRAFRFGVVAAPTGDGEQWQRIVRRVEELGYSTLLVPDGPQLLSSFPSLAVAASATRTIRVGSYVVASPLRHPRLAAWDAHSLSVLTGGRFDMGIGTGRPEVAEQAVELFGQPRTTVGQRLGQVEQTIDWLRELDGDQRTPVLVAAGGPRARALAAAKADIVALSVGPLGSRQDMARAVAELHDAAGERADQVELQTNIFVLGDQMPEWTARFLGTDPATLIAHDSLVLLRGGSPRQMADELQRRRDAFGVSYVSINAAFMEQMVPVAELLTGT
ncbi:MAG: LLM class flavin-dependent oxidoreductase [Chloroflexi bacterium]|nr:MAG: LLM class flavin-dependent oxidoreductase [Chloroflexota bacterium]